MKESRFNFIVASPANPKLTFLYNSLHDHRVAVEDAECNLRDLLSKVAGHESLSPEELEAADGLREMGYLIEDEVDEEATFKNWFGRRVKEQSEILTVTILTTLACNLRCTYCYEKDKLGKSRMSEATLRETIDWIKTRVSESSCVKLNLIYFGGEPLLNVEAIREISGELIPFCLMRGVEFAAGMATNGIFLTPELVDELKEYGLQWVKITFDGDQCEHDKRRIYQGGKGTFQKIFENLEKCAGRIKILLGGNFDEQSADSFKTLMQKIAASKFKDDIAATCFKPILPEMKKRELEGIASSCQRCTYTDFEIQKMLELRSAIRSVGLKPTDPINTGPCEFYRRNAVTIGIDGKIYKCIAFLGLAGTEIGHVTQQQFNETGEAMLRASRPFEHPKCKSCAFPPICGGGCRADAYNATGSFNNISCQQEYFKKTIREELALEYLEGAECTEQMGGVGAV